jgi:menaquinol-cytochrome c reductase iron-sulfur subunit
VSERAGEPVGRRDVLGWFAATAAGLGCLAQAGACARSLVPRVSYEPSPRRRLGPPSRFPEGVTFLAEEKVFVLRAEDRLRALSATCTHLGCTVQARGEGFHCPCHGSRFGGDGAPTAGPASRPLPWRPLSLAPDGAVVVDLAAEAPPDASLEVGGA